MGDGCKDYVLDNWGFLNAQGFLRQARYHNQRLNKRGYQLTNITDMYLPHYVKLYSSDITNWTFWEPALPRKRTSSEKHFAKPSTTPSSNRSVAPRRYN